MAMNFAGVSNNGDGQNEIVVRGNSPKGILWRLEGIEIPNPNHFSAMGNSGGAISMLSSSTLGNSDFYTGAFPAEIGNALSGVFDLKFREGNTDKKEHSLMIGALGLEGSTEGPFRKGGQASYLVNARYSTLSLMKSFLSNLSGVLPDYQDLSFKLNFPTKKAGTFTVFGLGGLNKTAKDPKKDSLKWTDDDPNFVLNGKGKYGVAGITHQYFLSKNAYVKTILSASIERFDETVDTLNPVKEYQRVPTSRAKLYNNAIRGSILYNNKINNRNTLRAGVIASSLSYNMDNRYYDKIDKEWKYVLQSDGQTMYYQAYVQLKNRISNKLTFNGGLHGSLFALNNTYSIEPRAAITYQLPSNQTVTFSAGLHSKPEHLSTYMFESVKDGQTRTTPNKNLDLSKAAHFVLAYDKSFKNGLRLKAEAYYQHLYNIPIEKDTSGFFSIVNSASVYDLEDTKPLINDGTGNNYGIDITFEKPFANNYYFLTTGSLFKSTYTTYAGKTFDTRYNRNYLLNLVAGKEWKTGAEKNKVIGVNAKVMTTGGLRESPIDIEASKIAEKTKYVKDLYFTEKGPVYYRFDFGFSYKINKKHSTHTIMFDVQNLTNHQNLFYSYYDNKKGVVKKVYQMGVFPIINYRVEF
jgi:hypothetical protein